MALDRMALGRLPDVAADRRLGLVGSGAAVLLDAFGRFVIEGIGTPARWPRPRSSWSEGYTGMSETPVPSVPLLKFLDS